MGKHAFVTMRAVAERAGVSVMTVSRALRNEFGVSRETRRRVLKAADEIGYRPNPMLAALMANLRSGRAPKSVDVIGYLTAHPERGGGRALRTFSSFFEGASERAERLGFRLEEFWLREPGMTDARLSRILRARGIAGIVVAPFPVPAVPLALKWENFALAAIGYSLTTPILHRTSNHQIHSIRVALEKLVERGYRRIGLALESGSDERSDYNWTTAFLYHQRELAAKERIPPLLCDALRRNEVQKWVTRWNPGVVIGARLELVDWLGELGLRVPDEIGYVNIDRYPEMTGVAGIDENNRWVGAAAVDLVVEQLYSNDRGIPKKPKVVLIEGEWVDGESLPSRVE